MAYYTVLVYVMEQRDKKKEPKKGHFWNVAANKMLHIAQKGHFWNVAYSPRSRVYQRIGGCNRLQTFVRTDGGKTYELLYIHCGYELMASCVGFLF